MRSRSSWLEGESSVRLADDRRETAVAFCLDSRISNQSSIGADSESRPLSDLLCSGGSNRARPTTGVSPLYRCCKSPTGSPLIEAVTASVDTAGPFGEVKRRLGLGDGGALR